MSEFTGGSEIERRAQVVQEVMSPGGVLNDIAQFVLAETLQNQTTDSDKERARLIIEAHPEVAAGPGNLNPTEVGNVLLPPRQPGQAYEARWQLIEGAPELVKRGVAANEGRIFAAAAAADLRHAESITDTDVARIDREKAVITIEPGANRTGVVRRGLAEDVADRVYGAEDTGQIMYQFGGDRPIPKQKTQKDGTVVDNPEYKIAVEIAGNFLPEDDSLTEFGLNLASALQAGYEITADAPAGDRAERVMVLQKAGARTLLLVKPYVEKGGLTDGFEAVHRLEDATGKQFVVATNGQYRAKDELQAASWAEDREVDMLPPVAIGDEPGYTVEHNGKVLTTAPRKADVYPNELVILQRLQAARQEA